MSDRNGRNGLAEGGIYDLGEAIEETRPVAIRRGGERLVLRGYVPGGGCPGLVSARVNRALLRYRDATRPDGGEFRYDPVAEVELRRDMLLAVVDGLEFSEAELFCDSEKGVGLLRHLGWWTDEAEATDDTPPAEMAGSAPITADSSPNSRGRTTGSARRTS